MLYYLLLHHLMLCYINVVLCFDAELILGYFNVALFDAALFNAAILNVVLF